LELDRKNDFCTSQWSMQRHFGQLDDAWLRAACIELQMQVLEVFKRSRLLL